MKTIRRIARFLAVKQLYLLIQLSTPDPVVFHERPWDDDEQTIEEIYLRLSLESIKSKGDPAYARRHGMARYELEKEASRVRKYLDELLTTSK